MKKPVDIDALIAEAVPMRPDLQFALTMDIRVVSEANESEHWRTKHARKKKQQEVVSEDWIEVRAWRMPVAFPHLVRLIRIGPKRLDSDNLAGSFKHVQDEIARQLGVDDGDERITWEYAQVPVGKRVYQVRVEVY